MYNVLIVDDSKTVHAYLKEAIGSHFKLLHLLDSRECVEYLNETRPDLVILDLEMPHLNGFELSKLIHEDCNLNTIPVLILTGSYNEKLIVSAINSFAMDIISKNSNPEFLVQKINGIIRQKQLIETATKEKQLMAINAMLATANHEINNSLQVLDSYLSKCKRNPETCSEVNLNKMHESCRRIHETIKKLNRIGSVELDNYTSETLMLKI